MQILLLSKSIFSIARVLLFNIWWFAQSIPNLRQPFFNFDLRQSIKPFWGQQTNPSTFNSTFFVGSQHFRILHQEYGYIYVGGRNRLFNISISEDGSIVEHKHFKWEVPVKKVEACSAYYDIQDCQNYIMLFARLTPDKILICGTYAFEPQCGRYQYIQENEEYILLTPQVTGMGFVPFNPYQNFTYTIVDGAIFSGTFVDVWSELPIIYREPVRTVAEFPTALSGPQFVHSFKYGDHVYFIFTEREYPKSSQYSSTTNHKKNAAKSANQPWVITSSIARVCINDSGYLDLMWDKPLTWKTFLKTKLKCTVPNGGPVHGYYTNEKLKEGRVKKAFNPQNSVYAHQAKQNSNYYFNPTKSKSMKNKNPRTMPNGAHNSAQYEDEVDPRDRKDLTAFTYDTVITATSPSHASGGGRFYAAFTAFTPPNTVPSSAICSFYMRNIVETFERGTAELQGRLDAHLKNNYEGNPNLLNEQSKRSRIGECDYDLIKPDEADFLQNNPSLVGGLEIEGEPLTVWSGKLPSSMFARYFDLPQGEIDANQHDYYYYKKAVPVFNTTITLKDSIYLGSRDGSLTKIAVGYRNRVGDKNSPAPSLTLVSVIITENLILSTPSTVTGVSRVMNRDRAETQFMLVALSHPSKPDFLTTVPVERCSRHISCAACYLANLGDPRCTWDASRHKCHYSNQEISFQNVFTCPSSSPFKSSTGKEPESNFKIDFKLVDGSPRHDSDPNLPLIINPKNMIEAGLSSNVMRDYHDGESINSFRGYFSYPTIENNNKAILNSPSEEDRRRHNSNNPWPLPVPAELHNFNDMNEIVAFPDTENNMCSSDAIIGAKEAGGISLEEHTVRYRITLTVVLAGVLFGGLGFIIGWKCNRLFEVKKHRPHNKGVVDNLTGLGGLGCDDLMLMNTLHRQNKPGTYCYGGGIYEGTTPFHNNESKPPPANIFGADKKSLERLDALLKRFYAQQQQFVNFVDYGAGDEKNEAANSPLSPIAGFLSRVWKRSSKRRHVTLPSLRYSSSITDPTSQRTYVVAGSKSVGTEPLSRTTTATNSASDDTSQHMNSNIATPPPPKSLNPPLGPQDSMNLQFIQELQKIFFNNSTGGGTNTHGLCNGCCYNNTATLPKYDPYQVNQNPGSQIGVMQTPLKYQDIMVGQSNGNGVYGPIGNGTTVLGTSGCHLTYLPNNNNSNSFRQDSARSMLPPILPQRPLLSINQQHPCQYDDSTKMRYNQLFATLSRRPPYNCNDNQSVKGTVGNHESIYEPAPIPPTRLLKQELTSPHDNNRFQLCTTYVTSSSSLHDWTTSQVTSSSIPSPNTFFKPTINHMDKKSLSSTLTQLTTSSMGGISSKAFV